MTTKTYGAMIHALTPHIVLVETHSQRGLPRFDLIGLAQTAVQEGKNRVISALQNSGFSWAQKKLTVNLAPATLRKDSAGLDFPIAISILGSLGFLSVERITETLFLGELSLDGRIQPTKGAFAVAELAYRSGFKEILIAKENAQSVALIEGLRAIPVQNLSQAVDYLQGRTDISIPSDFRMPLIQEDRHSVDWSEVGGQVIAKRALEIAAAGNHNVLLCGPPGIGKSLLARRFPTILPNLEDKDWQEVQRIRSLYTDTPSLSRTPPFRSPHHHASLAGMVGGGRPFRPGELSLSHCGVLFLDELPEFRRDVIEMLREPLEEGVVTLHRAEIHERIPSRFLLVAAMNLCPCGALGDPKKACVCTPQAIEKYQRKISGPIRDRIDLHVQLAKPSWDEVWSDSVREDSQTVRARVTQARSIQKARLENSGRCNGGLRPAEIRRVCRLGAKEERFLKDATDRLAMSARSIHKVLGISRTLADLENVECVKLEHIAEALQYRPVQETRF